MSDLHYFRPDWIIPTDQKLTVDICVYGATSAGVTAAIEATRRGKRVCLLQPGKFVGGLTTGGLGWTDYGKMSVIGGLAREFYRRVGKQYGKDEEFLFEPHAAQAAIDEMLAEVGVKPLLCQYLDKVELTGGQITRITMLGGLEVRAGIFIDATYDGDLMAKAGVSFHVGRESNDVFGETLNGIQVRGGHQFSPATVDPYVVEGDPSSGLLPQVEPIDHTKRQGQGDHRVQAYCFRICMTDDPALRIDWQKPERFDPKQYIIASRWFSGPKDAYNEHFPEGFEAPQKFDIFPHKTPGGGRKTDTNNHGPVSSDFIGGNWGWATADYAKREEIFQAHVTYQQGFYWFMANDPSIPERYRAAYGAWGLCRDEFTTTGGWSHTLYIREARRMVSDYVLTELDCMHRRKCEDPVGMGSYNLDSHNCTRFVGPEGKVLNDGDVQVAPAGPYGVSYRSIIPHRTECTNLLVPVCVSSSHIAYGSVRMEPVFMVLGQSAATAACLALDRRSAVQAVPYATLRAELEKLNQVVEAE